MSTQDFSRDPSRPTTTTGGTDPLESAAVVPDDPFTEPPAGPLTDHGVQGTPPVAGAGTPGTGTTGGQDTKSAAKDEARQVGHEGAETAKQVGHTAKEEAGKVAQEAKEQARNLVGELGSDLRSQAGAQQQRAAQGLRAISDELRSMADGSQAGGTASSLVGQAAGKAGDAAEWLDGRDPGSLLDDVRGFARRRPGVFLAVAAGAGLLAGRLARGMTGPDSNDGGASGGTSGSPASYSGVNTPPEPVRPPADTYPPAETYGAKDTGFESPTVTGAQSGTDVGEADRFPVDLSADPDRGYPRP